MSYNPTLVSASLSDDELQKSINSLVNKFKDATDKMRGYMDSAVKDIKTQLQSLGNVNINLGTASDGGSTKRVRQEQAVTQAIKETTAAKKEQKVVFDNVAAAQDKALNVKSARDSYYAMFEGMREQANHLKQLITSWENLLLQRKIGEFEQVGAQITATTQKINALKAEITQLRKTQPTGYRSGIKEKEAEIDRLKTKIDELKVKQQEVANAPIQDNSYLANARQKLAEIKTVLDSQFDTQTKITREIVKQNSEKSTTTRNAQEYATAQKQVVEYTSRQLENFRDLRNNIKDAARELRSSDFSIKRYYETHSNITGESYKRQIFAENDARAQGLTIEEQIMRVLREKQAAEKDYLAATQQVTQEKEKQAQVENSSKKKYTSPYVADEYLAYRNAIANKLGIDKNRIINADANTDSINRLNAALKQMQAAYVKMDNMERNSPFGRQLLKNMQDLQRQTQQLRSEMARPISLKEALAGTPKTLDDIAYKMRQLNAYRQGIDLTKTGADKEILQVDQALAKLQKDMDKYMSKSKDILERNNALARSWNYMKNRLAFYFTIGASTQFVKTLIDIRSQYEMNERALGILINSAERGSQIFQELSNMALVSPYTLIELSAAAKQLTAYDVAARDVVDTTRRLADMASAVGVPIERLTYALGQIKAYGYLNSRDNRMFANAGIPLVKQLADYYTELEGKMVSTADVYDRIKKKAVGYNDVMQVINKMTDEGGKFFDFQAKMADTLKVRMANLTLAWNNMLNDIGKSEQGLLTWAIGSLRNFFLQWRNINRVVSDVAITFGVLKVAQLAYYGVMVGTNKAIAMQTILGTRLTNILRNLTQAMSTALTSPATWVGALAVAIGGAISAILRGNEAMVEFNKNLRENAATTYEDLQKFSDQYQKIRNSLYSDAKQTTPNDINVDEATKAWEAMREQIELSSHAGNDFVGRLLSIENVSERLREGFRLLDDIQIVSAALKELGDDGIKLKRDWSDWWNLWMLPDGAIENLKDAHGWLTKINDEFGSIAAAEKISQADETAEGLKNVFKETAGSYLKNYEKELERFREDLTITTNSVIDFIEGKGWQADTNKIEEVFRNVFDKIAENNNLSPDQAMTLRLEAAQAEYDALEKALKIHIDSENEALKHARDENARKDIQSRLDVYNSQLNFMLSETAQSRVYWRDFVKWMGAEHKSEVQAMFGNMTADQIKALDFSSEEYQKWIQGLTQKYEKEHKLAFGSVFTTLYNYVKNANQWSIYIPLIIGTTEQKSIYEQLSEADTQADAAFSKIERLKKELTRLDNLGGRTSSDEEIAKRAAEVEKEIAAAEKDAAAAEKEGGISKKEESAARKANAAASKAERQAETELQKALKDELQLLDKVRNVYKSLTKDGVATTDALAIATSGYDKTLSHINTVLGKHGIAPLDITKFAGVQNPQAVMMMLQKQLDTLMKSSAVKPTEIKDLEVKLKDLRVDAASFNQKTITDSLNSELSKLDEEYQLSIALQADPELGDMFLNMFDIAPNELPKTIDDYAERVAAELNKALEKENISLPHLNLTDDDLAAFKNLVNSEKLTQAGYELIEKQALKIRGMRKQDSEDTYKKTKELEYKLADTNGKIAIEEEKLHTLEIRLANETRNEKKRLLELQIEDQKLAIDKLKEEVLQMLPTYKALFGSVAEHSAVMTRRLAKQYMDMLKNAKQGADGRFTITDPRNGKQTTLSKKELGKQEDKAIAELRKSQSSLSKIRESFTKGDEEVVDFWKGIEQVGVEMQKLSTVVKNVGSLAELLGADRETVEVIGDIAESISGVATLSQGVAQIASGDYLGGAASVIGGLTQAMSTWLDNGNNRINDEIKKSELAVKRLQVAYVDLQKAADAAYGSGVVGAKKAVAAAKELQLAEMERQLRLEESRDSKHRDDEKIADLRRQIKELRYEINETITEVTNDLLGSDVGSFAENLVSSMIDAFKQGEDYMQVFEDKFAEMIDNMIMKSIVSRVVTQYLDVLWNNMDEKIKQRSQAEQDALQQAQANLAEIEGMSPREWAKEYGLQQLDKQTLTHALFFRNDESDEILQTAYNAQLKAAQAAEKAAQDALTAAGVMQDSDITELIEELAAFKPELGEKIKELLGMYYRYGQENDKELSALQQGIQGITEDTAGALEAYMNGVSQQVYLHSDLLTQIRDAVVGYDLDVQVATMSQMLLQLRSSYEVQQSIQSILSGWSSPNGLAVRVELNS